MSEFRDESDSEDYFEGLAGDFLSWLADMLSHFNRIGKYFSEVPSLVAHPDATVEYKCADCGKCCHFNEHYVWVSPIDILAWLKRYSHDRRIGSLLFSLAQVEDNDGYMGLALISKQSLNQFISDIKKDKSFPKETREIYEKSQEILQSKIKNYNKEENSCVFYDPDSEHHCTIYDIRPNQCKTYPYDYPRFSKINPELVKLKKYGIAATDLENDQDEPYCPKNAYNPTDKKGFIKLTEENLKTINLDKIAFITTQETEDLMADDLVEIIAELFYKDILTPDKPNKQLVKEIAKFIKNPQDYSENLRINNI